MPSAIREAKLDPSLREARHYEEHNGKHVATPANA